MLETKAPVCVRAREKMASDWRGGPPRRSTTNTFTRIDASSWAGTRRDVPPTQRVPPRPDDGEATRTRPHRQPVDVRVGFLPSGDLWPGKDQRAPVSEVRGTWLWPTFLDLPQSQCVRKVKEFWVTSAQLLHAHWPLTFFFCLYSKRRTKQNYWAQQFFSNFCSWLLRNNPRVFPSFVFVGQQMRLCRARALLLLVVFRSSQSQLPRLGYMHVAAGRERVQWWRIWSEKIKKQKTKNNSCLN